MLVRIINKDGRVSEYTQNKDSITFGRDATNDIPVADEKVSRNHLIIVKEQGLLKVKDLGSTNGTYIDSVKINPQMSYDISLTSNIKIGNTTIGLIDIKAKSSEGGKKLNSLIPVFIIVPIIIIAVVTLIVTNFRSNATQSTGTAQITQVTDTSSEVVSSTTANAAGTTDQTAKQNTDTNPGLNDIKSNISPSIVEITAQNPNSDEGVYGSGIIYSKDGYIITNNHIIENYKLISVRDSNQNEYEADIIAFYPEIDIAVLKIDNNKAVSPKFGDSSKLKVGDSIIAIGNPYGLAGTVTAGIVSAIRDMSVKQGGVVFPGMIQHDAAMNEGNSGGALVNSKGEVVGVNSFIISSDGTNTGLGFAIPINLIIEYIKNDLNINPGETSAVTSESILEEETQITQSTQQSPYSNNFTLKDLTGKSISLSDFQGKNIVLNFFASWCPPCREEIPDFIDVYNSYKGKNWQFIGVSLDSELNAINTFVSESKINYPVLMDDGKVSNIWGITAIPTTFILDVNGNIAYGPHEGSMSKQDLINLIEALK